MRYIAVLLCAGLLAVPLAAQDSSTPVLVRSGETLTLELSAEQMQELRFVAQAGDVLDLSVVGMGVAAHQGVLLDVPPDPSLTLLSPDGLELKYVDDTPESVPVGEASPRVPLVSTDAHLRGFMLPQTGEYRLRVDSFSGVTTGRLEVRLTLTPPRVPELSLPEPSDTHTESLTLLARRDLRFTLSLKADERLQIIARDVSGTLDPLLTLLDAQGNIVAENDDAPPAWWIAEGLDVLDAGLDFSAPAEGEYTLHLRDYLGRGGEVELVLKRP